MHALKPLEEQPHDRLLLAAGAAALPLVVVSIMFFEIGGAFPAALPADIAAPALETNGATLAPASVAALNGVIISSAIMLAVCLGVIFWSLAQIHVGLGGRATGVAALIVLTASAGFVATPHNPLIIALVERPLVLASEAEVWAAATFAPAIDLSLKVGMFAGGGAIVALLMRFMLLCLQPASCDEISTLRHQASALRAAVFVGSVMLTSAALATYFYYSFPVSMLAGSDAPPYAALSAQASIRWGACYTISLACAATPALAAFAAGRNTLMHSPNTGGSDVPDLFEAPVLADRLRQVATIAAVLLPAGAVPVIEAIKTLTSG